MVKNLQYFCETGLRMIVQQPLDATDNGEVSIYSAQFQGGLSGQAGAIRHGISKALLILSPRIGL